MDFRYLAQALAFSDDTLLKVSKALQEFHDNKDAIIRAGERKDSWEIPKLELLQGVVPDIHRAGPVMQWSADPTEHAHIQEIQIPARSGNNQDYYNQITRHLDQSEKCLLFDMATYLESNRTDEHEEDDNTAFDQDAKHDIDPEDISLTDHLHTGISAFAHIDYFAKAEALSCGCIPNAPKPH